MNRVIQVLCVTAVAVSGSTALAADIKTVSVGDVGNPADVRYESPGYGAVNYEYKIGKYEVTVGQYCEFLNAVGKTDTYGLYNTKMWSFDFGCKIQRLGDPGGYTYRVPDPNRVNRPVNYVSWGDAARFANWLHNDQPAGPQDRDSTEDGAYRLDGATSNEALIAIERKAGWKWAIASEDEWFKAAYYNPSTGLYYDYPTGDTAPGYVNDSGALSGTGDPFTEDGTDPGNYATYDGDGGIDGIGGPYYATEVGEWENSYSPYGTFDQGGNVREWNEGIIIDSFRGMRGGSFAYVVPALRAVFRYDGPPTDENSVVGFRVSRIPEPAAMAILMAGGVAIFRRPKSVRGQTRTRG
ncbi:MAG: SUMF1/EgtB/PvdO family nonheme iron enzyme [Phycisphaerae bacterium]|jgi:formylglycine-generating enzyme required for sulfatase activity|nr:SUMF1/EgtB/PvdO family nonheme iron enzyme [Phycisphaerae bacterium]